jgi:hypothetical protein
VNATNAYLNADLSINLSRRMNERAAARTQSRPSAPAKTQNPFAGQTISQGRIGGPSTLDNLKTNIAARSAQSSNPLRAMPTPSLMDQGIMNGAASIMDGFNMASSAAMGTIDTLTSYGNVANPGDRLRIDQLNAIAALAAPVLGSVGRMEGIGSVVEGAGGVAAERTRLSNVEVRTFYNQQLKALDTSGPLTESTAMRVHEARNALKLEARDLMSDRAGAARLAQKNSVQPFEYYVDKYSAQGYKGVALWQRIIQGSTTPNPIVNSKFGIK